MVEIHSLHMDLPCCGQRAPEEELLGAVTQSGLSTALEGPDSFLISFLCLFIFYLFST